LTTSDERDDRDDQRGDRDKRSEVGQTGMRASRDHPRLEDEERDENGRDDSGDDTHGEGHDGSIFQAPSAVTAMKIGSRGSATVPVYALVERTRSFGPSTP
jgi:hypothetical protein